MGLLVSGHTQLHLVVVSIFFRASVLFVVTISQLAFAGLDKRGVQPVVASHTPKRLHTEKPLLNIRPRYFDAMRRYFGAAVSRNT